MKKLLLLLSLLSIGAFAADEVIRQDKVKIGRPGSGADKVIELDTGSVNNAQVSSDSAQRLKLRSNTLRKGRGAAADIYDEFDIGAGANNPKFRWNNTTGKIEFAHDGVTYEEVGSGGGGGGGGGITLNENPGFEDGTTNWTASGGTFTIETTLSNVGFGLQSGAWDASAASQTLSGQLVAVPAGLFGKTCSLSWYYKGGDANLKAQVYDGTNVIAESSALSAQTTFSAKQVIYFICPSSGSIQPRFIASANAAIVYLDEVRLGQENLFSVSSNGFLGKALYPGTASCTWSTIGSPTVYGNFPVQVSCPTPTVTGKISAPGTKIPGVTFEAEAGKTYRFLATGLMRPAAAADGCSFRFSDGTESSDMIARAGQVHFAYSATGVISFSTGGTKTVQIQSRTESAADNCQIVNSIIGNDFSIQVDKLDGTPESAISIDKMGWYIDGNIGGANISLSTSDVSTYTEVVNANLDLVLDSGSAAAEIPCSTTNPSTGTTCSAGSEGVGIVFTPPTAGRYEVCASFTHDLRVSTGDGESTFEIVQTPNNAQTILARGGARQTSGMNANTDASGKDPHYLCGNFTLADTSKATFRVMYVNDNISGIAQNDIYASRATGVKGDKDIRFTVRRRVEFQDAVKFTNLVTTSRQDGLKTEIVRIAESGNIALKCTTSPCGLFNNSGGFASATRASAGEYTLTINGGVFSQIPNCQAQGNGSSNVAFAFGTATSTTSYAISFRRATDAQPEDGYIDVTCVGF